MDTLSLSMLPLASNTLKNAKLVKNPRMETTVELFSDPLTGSLQVMPDKLSEHIATNPRDQEIINSLSNLHSFDVYSLRTSLKKLGIEVANAENLELSEGIKNALSIYSLQFTRPLIEQIFGGGRFDLNDPENFQKIFKDPDVARVRENLAIMAQKTGLAMQDIPKFLEEYNEVFVSVAYYRHSFENIRDHIDRFLFWMRDLKTHRDVTSSPKTLAHCKKTEETLRFLSGSIQERLARFQYNFEMFWKEINRASFDRMRHDIEQNHSSMGAVLCGLVVKMNDWAEEFPTNEAGGPTARSKYIITEFEPGLDRLRDMEADARKKLGMSAIKI